MNEIYSGYDITLNKLENRAYKGKMLGIEGNSYQETREGYNKLKNTATTQTINGVTFTVNKDGTVIVNGTATANAVLTLENDWTEYTKGTYRLTGCPSGGAASTYRIVLWKEGYVVNAVDIGNGTNVTFDGTTKHKTQIFIESGVTANNLIFEPMITEGTKSKPYEKYGASPSIEHEAPIESVGDNINLFDIESITESYYLNQGNGALGSSTSSNTSDYIPVIANETYIVTYDYGTLVAEGKRGYCYFDKNKTYLKGSEYTSSNKTFTLLPTEDGYIRFAYDKNCKNIKVEKGTKATPYSPYGQGSIVVYNVNKNFLNIDSGITSQGITTVLNEDGSLSVSGTSTSTYANLTDFILCNLPIDTYMFSIDTILGSNIILRFYDVNKTSLSSYYIGATTKSSKISLTGEEVYYRLLMPTVNGTMYNFTTYLQLERGTEPSNYVAHQSQTKALYTQQPFRSIGDIRDRFVKIDGIWYEEHKNLRYIFTGNEGWKKSSRTDVNRYYVDNIINTILNASTVDILCSHFKALTPSQSDTAMIGISKYNEKGLMVNVDLTNTELDTVDKFKAKLTELYNTGTPVYVDYVLAEPELIPCTPQQSTILDQLENIQLYDGVNYIYTTDGIQPLLTLELYNLIEDYDLYVSNDGYFGIPGTDIKFLVNFHESNLPTMPEAVEASVRAAGRDGDYVLNTTYEPLPFEIVCYTEDNLTPTQKKEIESKVNRFLNSIKNRTKKIAFEKGEKFYNVKYNGLLTTTNYPAHLKFSIPLKSSESFGKDAYQKVLSGNSTEVSDTVEEVGALITINGPATLPIIALNDYSMEYSTSILEGARIEIDTAKSTATHINSDGVKTNVMRYYNHQFPKIQPGENTLKVLSGVDDENNVTVKWNDLKL